MGTHMSLLRKKLGVSGKKIYSPDAIFNQFFGTDIRTFEEFHTAFLDFYVKFNAVLPGRHYNAPSLESLVECYKKWEESSMRLEEKKDLVIELMERHVSISSHADNTILLTGLVAPSAAMFLKKAVPNAIFVPFCTLLAVGAAKAMQVQMNKIT